MNSFIIQKLQILGLEAVVLSILILRSFKPIPNLAYLVKKYNERNKFSQLSPSLSSFCAVRKPGMPFSMRKAVILCCGLASASVLT